MSTSAKPPPLPPRHSIHPIVSTDENLPVNDDLASQGNAKEQGVDHAEDELPEQRLRELYDDEEIDRFLNLFSACVTEVRLPESPTSGKLDETVHRTSGNIFQDDTVPVNSVEEGDWVPVLDCSDAPTSDNVAPPSAARCLSEEIALRYLVPILPPPALPPPAFTLGRLRLTTQRLYLVIEPAYKPFFVHMCKLATWEDRRQSSIYCTVFWILWYHNLLLPAFFLRTLYSLIRRKVLPYPTVAELREHRREIRRATEFGDEIQARLSVSSVFGMKEMWRLFKIFNKSSQTKARNLAKDKGKMIEIMPPNGDEKLADSTQEGATVLDDTKESREEKDIKRTILHCLSEISDLHERIKNIFIWRRPVSSRKYGAVMFLFFLVTIVLPARYLAKLTYFICGILFWHITPTIAALPLADRARLPAPFRDAPTDADYAMELISRRVAAGLPVKPLNRKTSKKRNSSDGEIALRNDGGNQSSVDRDQSIDWKKWGARAAIGKGWAGDGKRIVTGGQWPSQHARGGTQPETNVESHTFPAQHNGAPGLINLTPTMLLFTPIMSMNAKITIPLQDLRGVKKTGLFKGLSIRWDETGQDGSRVENEEKFPWVGSRDELFVRLLGTDGRRWMRA